MPSPATPGFGHPGWTVPFDLDADPAEVLATYATSRIIASARAVLGENAPQAQFIRKLYPGGHGTDTTAGAVQKACSRLLSGPAIMSVADMLRWCHVFEVDLDEILGSGLRDRGVYPPMYRAVLRVPSEGLPQFVSPSRVDWGHVAKTYLERLRADEDAVGRAFLDDSIGRLRVVQSLRESGIANSLLRPVGVNGVEILGQRRVTVTTSLCCDESEDSWGAMRRSLVSPGGDILVIAAAPAAQERMRVEFSGLFDLQRGESLEVQPFSYELVPDVDPLNAVTWTSLGVSGDAELAVRVYERKR